MPVQSFIVCNSCPHLLSQYTWMQKSPGFLDGHINLHELQGSQPITNMIGSQSVQSLVPWRASPNAAPRLQKGKYPHFIGGTMKSTLDPRVKIAKNLNSPGFLQNLLAQQPPSDLPVGRRENKKQRAKKQALSHSGQG